MSSPRRHLLVVDDDAAAVALTQAALRKAGFDVTVALNGEQAFSLFGAGQFDLVLLDVEMPGLDGHEVCRQLRAKAGPLLPIVMLTGRDDVDSVDRAYQAGATDFIGKPVNWSLLGYRVKYFLRSYDASLALQTAEARNSALLDAIPDALLELDVEGRHIAYQSRSASELLLPGQSLVGRSLSDVLPVEAAQLCLQALREAERRGVSTGQQISLVLPRGTVWYELSAARKSAAEGRRADYVLVARDITERLAAEHRIRRLAYVDTLTGLPNRTRFYQLFAGALEDARQQRLEMALIAIDLDDFKRINDTLGHSVGDELLRQTAARLDEAMGVRRAAHLSRLGGDEFTVLLSNVIDSAEAKECAELIRQALVKPMRLAQHDVLVTPSVGIAMYPADGQDDETLLKNADLAMYFAKRRGGGGVAAFEPSMNAQALQRLTMEAQLRTALSNNELSLVYQPQFHLGSGVISGIEALLRWSNPHLGTVPPNEFVPVAEATGLILPIGEWVLRTVCAQAKRWLQEGLDPARIAINISGVQLSQAELPVLIGQVLQQAGLPPKHLEIEITESLLMHDEDLADARLQRLKQLGIGIAIDDFGTGYSNFRRLKDFPIDRLKIDRSFIHRLQSAAADCAIVTAIITMAKALQLEVVAEGIEDVQQMLFLQAEDCDQGQGYLLSRPLSAADAEALLRRAKAHGEELGRTARLRTFMRV
jgi:diguanylate cyclase (GGDEF)-like protein/PAS domain S-box-containing protein